MFFVSYRISLILVFFSLSFWFFDATRIAHAQEAYKESMEWLSLESSQTPIGTERLDIQDQFIVSPPPVLAIPELSEISFQYPLLIKPVITSFFEPTHPGIDFAVPAGSAIVAAESGLVTEVGWSSIGYGNTIVLHHTNNTYTRYAHLLSMNVSIGQYIIKGMPIGLVGCTGRCTGPHLHFEIRMNNQFIDPLL